MNDHKVWDNFLSWVRFCVYRGNLADLYEQVKEYQFDAVEKAVEDGRSAKRASEYIWVYAQDLDTEVLVWLKIQELTLNKLQNYTTTFEEDSDLLASKESNLTSNQRNMVKLRMGEKTILMRIFEMSDAILKLMQLDKKEAIKYMMKNHADFKKCLKYI